MIRAFIAVHLPAAIRDLLAQSAAELRGNTIAVKWVEPQNLHMTLAFLGDIDPGQVETVAAALARAADGEPAITASIGSLGAFPNLRRPRVIWARLGAGGPEFGTLTRRVRDELRAAGVHFDDKPFSPHVTLGRVREGVVPPSEFLRRMEAARLTSEPFDIGAVHLMKSRLTPSGPIHDALGVVALGQSR